MALTLRKPTRSTALLGRSRPAYAHGGAVPSRRAMTPEDEVRHGHRQHPIPPQAGGPVGLAPPNPTGKPPHELAQISAEVRAGVRPPSWPSAESDRVQETPAHIRRALDLARGINADGGGNRTGYATGGTVDEGSAPWLNPVGNQMAQQMLSSGMPQFAAYQQTGWKPINGQLQYDPQAQQQQPAAARPQFAQGGSIHPHVMRALAMAEAARREHLATGGQILSRLYAARPRFDDGGGAGGDGGGSSGSGGDGGTGGPGGDGSSGMGGEGSGSTGNGMSGGLGGTSAGDGSTGMGGVGGAVGGTSDAGMGIGSANAAGSDASASAGYGGFGFGGIDGPGSPAANAAGSIGATPAGMSTSGISAMGVNASAANDASGLGAFGSAAPSAGMSVSGPVGGIDGSAPAPSFGSFSGTQAGMAAANAGLSGFGQGFGANGLGSAVGSLGGTSDNTFGANGVAGTSMSGDMASAPTSNAFGSLNPGSFSSDPGYGDLTGQSPSTQAFGMFGSMQNGDIGGLDPGIADVGTTGFTPSLAGVLGTAATPASLASAFNNAPSPAVQSETPSTAAYGTASDPGLAQDMFSTNPTSPDPEGADMVAVGETFVGPNGQEMVMGPGGLSSPAPPSADEDVAPAAPFSNPVAPAQVAYAAPTAPTTAPTAATTKTLGPDDPNPADPTHTMDGTPLSTPDTATTTAPAAPNSWTSQPVPTDTTPGPATVATGLPAAPSLPADESDPSTLSQIGSYVAGLLGKSPLGSALSGIGSAIGGFSPGTAGGVGGSGNGNSGQTSSGTAGAIPINPNATAPASTGPAPQGSANAAAQARIAAILASIQGGAPASSGSYHPTYLQTQPPTTAGATPYNPLQDPYVLRALGLAGV